MGTDTENGAVAGADTVSAAKCYLSWSTRSVLRKMYHVLEKMKALEAPASMHMHLVTSAVLSSFDISVLCFLVGGSGVASNKYVALPCALNLVHSCFRWLRYVLQEERIAGHIKEKYHVLEKMLAWEEP